MDIISIYSDGVRVGGICFLRKPPHDEMDFVCTPRGLLNLQHAQQLASDLLGGKTSGEVNGFEWSAD
jgi:hypothetical protein